MRTISILFICIIVNTMSLFSKEMMMRKAKNCDCLYYTNSEFTWSGSCPNGIVEGYGCIQFYESDGKKSSRKLEGEFKNDYFKGTISDNDKPFIYGCWINQKRIGEFIKYSWDGTYYDKCFEKDEKTINGHWESCKRYLKDGTLVYEGDIYGGSYDGYGTLYIKDKGKYTGHFESDKVEGYGTLFDLNGNIICQGNWENGSFVNQNNSNFSSNAVVGTVIAGAAIYGLFKLFTGGGSSSTSSSYSGSSRSSYSSSSYSSSSSSNNESSSNQDDGQDEKKKPNRILQKEIDNPMPNYKGKWYNDNETYTAEFKDGVISTVQKRSNVYYVEQSFDINDGGYLTFDDAVRASYYWEKFKFLSVQGRIKSLFE